MLFSLSLGLDPLLLSLLDHFIAHAFCFQDLLFELVFLCLLDCLVTLVYLDDLPVVGRFLEL